MPPRLPPCALRTQFTRAFSSTPSIAAPPREGPHPHAPRAPTPSSSSNLLSISNDRHKRAPNTRSLRPGEAATKMMNRYTDKQNRSRLESVEALRNSKNSSDYLRQMPRRWDAGDVYSPHDLSPVEMQKWRKRSLRSNDVVDALGIRPLDMYKVRGCFCLVLTWWLYGLALTFCAELFSCTGIHYLFRTNYSFCRHEFATRQPAQDCQDDSSCAGNGYLPDHPRSSRDDPGLVLP